jgi:RHS repeat-associated protein
LGCLRLNILEQDYKLAALQINSGLEALTQEKTTKTMRRSLPYGETFFERRDYWNTPYKFNAKELDQETGLYYYGARYYTPEVSIWLSVDRFADKYPHLSPYHYCAGNPINLIDVNGDSIVLNGISSGFEGYTNDERLSSFERYLKDGAGGKVDVNFKSRSADGDGDVTFEFTIKEGETLTESEQKFFDFITEINGQDEDIQVGLGDLSYGQMPKGVFFENNYTAYQMTYDVAFDYKLLNAMPSSKKKNGFGTSEMFLLGLSNGDYKKFNNLTGFSVSHVSQGVQNNTSAYKTKISTESGSIIFKVRHFNFVFGNERDPFTYKVK